MRNRFSVLIILLLAALPLWPQSGAPADPASYIGLTLTELIARFGIPKSVYASRGLEDWQDDVVFVYNEGEFYIYKDRVWQIGIKEAYLIKAGDPRPAVDLSFGEALFSGSDFTVFTLAGKSWPMYLRFNFDSNGRVAMIFIYRSDL